MRYRVAFARRVESEHGDSASQPGADFEQGLPDGLITEKLFVEAIETDAQHSQEVLDEDDAFLGSAAPEVWEYDVVDERASEFEQALQRSELVLEYDVVDSTVTDETEITDLPPADMVGVDEDEKNASTEDVGRGGSGVRSGDDGPAGMPTGDPSAGGLASIDVNMGLVNRESLGKADSELEELSVMKARDPRLGLTNRGRKPPSDAIANQGQTRNPDRGVETSNRKDTQSTLGPRKRKGA